MLLEIFIILIIMAVLPVLIVIAAASVVHLLMRISPNRPFSQDLICYFKQQKRKPALFRTWRALLGDSGMQGLLCYRLARAFYRHRLRFFADIVRKIMIMFTAMDISPEAELGKGIEIFHSFGIVIGDGVVIGDRVWICQHVSVGRNYDGVPRIGNDVKIFAGARVLGGITVGDGATIGANAVVTSDVPAKAMVVPAKARMSE